MVYVPQIYSGHVTDPPMCILMSPKRVSDVYMPGQGAEEGLSRMGGHRLEAAAGWNFFLFFGLF